MWTCLAAALVLGIAGSAVLAADRRRARAYGEAQRALRESEERLRLALEAATDVVWDWDVARDAIYHPRWAHHYGFPEERTPASGRELGPFIHPDDLGGFMEVLGEAIEGKRDRFELEHRALARDGTWRWTLARARVVARDAGGRATRVVGTCSDTTERRRILARLQVSERLAAVGTLAAGVAHEINNPLAYVLGNVEHTLESLRTLARDLEDAGARPADAAQIVKDDVCALEEAAAGAARVRDIVRDLKLFSRAEDDDRRPTSVLRVLRSALNVAGPEIRRRATLRTDLAEVPTVVANESRLSQVFLNLLVNAAQAIGEGRPEQQEIAVATRLDARGQVVVEIRDTGCGIPLPDQKRIFDPFYTTKPSGVGTGLGLAICHGVVTALGGDIDVESSPGRGSTFRVSLPASGAPEPAAEASQPGAAARRSRILMVDDEEAFCRTVQRMLGGDHDLVVTSDPIDALRRVEAGEPYDVLLTDVVMPRLSGIELHARVQRVAPGLADRTLFVTGGATSPAVATFLAQRPGRVLEKPCQGGELRAAIASLLDAAARPALA